MTSLHDQVATILGRAGIADTFGEAEQIVRAAGRLAPEGWEAAARAMAERRAAGTPLGYVTGRAMFMGIELIAGEGTLVPRQETELLGRFALEALRASGSATPRVIDMCCGSGNLACAIAYHLHAAHAWACDVSDRCVAIARSNAEYVGVSDRVFVAQGDLFEALGGLGLEGMIDVVVCNPPYISQAKLAGARVELLAHEPREAFDGGPYGISILQRVVKSALSFLRPGGTLLFEIGLGQDRQVKLLFERAGGYEHVRYGSDGDEQVRIVSGRKRAG